jgi:Uncharacterized conserved protein
MLSSAIAKIKSAPKLRELSVLVAAVLLGAAAMAWYQTSKPEIITLTNFDRTTYSLEVARTAKAQAKGLSGRKTMAKDQGMLFAFPREGRQCFWMKDMHFPLDIIWLDQEQKVVSFERNVSPDSYPEKYCGEGDAMYVIELDAGQAARADMRIGDTLNF